MRNKNDTVLYVGIKDETVLIVLVKAGYNYELKVS